MADNVSIRIPTVLRTHVDGQAKVDMAGGTVGQVLGALLDAHPTLKGRLMDEQGEVNRFISCCAPADSMAPRLTAVGIRAEAAVSPINVA